MTELVSENQTDAPIELVGGKGKGLLTLKPLEKRLNEMIEKREVIVPSFFIIPDSLSLPENDNVIRERLYTMGADSYAIRSSSPLEDVGEHSFDGIFDTYLDVPIDNVLRRIQQVRESAKSEKAVRYAKKVNVELTDNMPVIVQAMVDKEITAGEVYSKFPAAKDILKVKYNHPSTNHGEETYVIVFLRNEQKNGSYEIHSSPLVAPAGLEWYDSIPSEIEDLANLALVVERELKQPVILEFATNIDSKHRNMYLLQARRLTKLSEAERFEMPELQEEGLLAVTPDVNGVGDFTGKVYVALRHRIHAPEVYAPGLAEFDEQHPEGYVLVTPYIQFSNVSIDSITPNKKAVIAYYDTGIHHDMEIARKDGILYININRNELADKFKLRPFEPVNNLIETGETVRVVSDGTFGYVFNT